MSCRRLLASLTAAAVLGTGCGSVRLPSAATPERIVPAVDLGEDDPPAPGKTRVVIDVVDGPTRVELVNEQAAIGHEGQAIVGSYDGEMMSGYVAPSESTAMSTSLLCISPCVVDLPRGTYELNFGVGRAATGGKLVTGGLGMLEVKKDPVVYRRAVGRRKPYESAKGTLGGGLLGLAVPLLISPLVLGGEDMDHAPIGGLLLGGVVLSIIGGWLLWDAREVVQPGAEVQFGFDEARAY